MKRTLTALAAAAALSVAAVPAAVAQQDDDVGQIRQSIINGLEAQGFETDNVDNLTLGEVSQIKTFLTQDGGGADQQIEMLLDRAAERAP